MLPNYTKVRHFRIDAIDGRPSIVLCSCDEFDRDHFAHEPAALGDSTYWRNRALRVEGILQELADRTKRSPFQNRRVRAAVARAREGTVSD